MVEDQDDVDETQLLIAAVKGYPCLYNSDIPQFKNQLMKESSWTAIAELLERPGK